MKIGDVVVTTRTIGGWSRTKTEEGVSGTVVGLNPLVARFFYPGSKSKTYEITLQDGEWR